ncbi:hypothetical protein H4R24_001609 [Coemansia sp. RSA 988]|nr:hypothetical protein H4R24_001609 [Coemansia sp. RSA 988]
MIIYTDRFTNDDMFSDAFRPKSVGITYEVDCEMVYENDDGDNFNLNNGEAEEVGGEVQVSKKRVPDVAKFNGLQEIFIEKKKEYKVYVKPYVKALIEQVKKDDPERVNEFKKGSEDLVSKVLANFDKYQFFVGRSNDFAGMLVLLSYREDGITPYLTFFKDGLKANKV